MSKVLPDVLARIPGMGAYLRKLEEEKATQPETQNAKAS